MDTTMVGVDLAKNVCVADCTGRIVERREFDTTLSPILRGLIQSVRDQLDALDARIGECDRQRAWLT